MNYNKYLFRLQKLVSIYPNIFIPLYKIFGKHNNLLVNANTDIVIEGFPRSGNTFSVVAFELFNRNDVLIAHHLHAAAQVIWAVRNNVPAMVLIRDPSDAVVSLLIREPDINIKQALYDYIRFYEALLPYKKSVLLAEFNVIISDYGKIMERFNIKYSKHYQLFEHTAENVEKVFDSVQQYGIQESSENILDERKVARPSGDRKKLAKELKKKLQVNNYTDLVTRANKVYIDFIDI